MDDSSKRRREWMIHQRREDQHSHWSSLPEDILVEILKYMVQDFSDHVAIRSVCAHWRHSLLRNTNHCCPPIPYPVLQIDSPSLKPFCYEINHTITRPISLPELSTRYCCTSSQGWMVLLDSTSPSMSLFNPLSNISIQLPPLTTFPDILGLDNQENYYTLPLPYRQEVSVSLPLEEMNWSFVSKIVLAPYPTSVNYTIMVMFGCVENKLAICKSGHNKWTLVPTIPCAHDIIHFKGHFWALSGSNLFKILISEVDHALNFSVVTVSALPSVPLPHNVYTKYLVELSGDLILIFHDKQVNKTRDFQVFKLENDSIEWQAIQSIGNHSLFVCAKSVLASQSARCKPNSIYFTSWEIKGFGIYSFETLEVEQHTLPSPYSPIIWFAPSFS